MRTLPHITQMMIFSPNTSFGTKKVSFDDFYVTAWKRESKRKKEPQIPRLKLQNFNRTSTTLLLNEESLFIFHLKRNRCVFVLQTNYVYFVLYSWKPLTVLFIHLKNCVSNSDILSILTGLNWARTTYLLSIW